MTGDIETATKPAENDRFGVVGTTMRCASGKYFDLAKPNVNDVDVNDIARALSNLCRFGGQCERFYSVARHSPMGSNGQGNARRDRSSLTRPTRFPAGTTSNS